MLIFKKYSGLMRPYHGLHYTLMQTSFSIFVQLDWNKVFVLYKIGFLAKSNQERATVDSAGRINYLSKLKATIVSIEA